MDKTEKRSDDRTVEEIITALLRLTAIDIPLDRFFNEVLKLILNIPWVTAESRGCIFIVEDIPDMLVMKAQHGLGADTIFACSKVPFGKCICGKTALSKNVHFHTCISTAHEVQPGKSEPHGHLCIPIRSSQKLWGVLNIYVRENHRRDARRESLLGTIADTLAGVIERKRIEIQFLHSQKMETIGRLAGSIAHDINNLMTPILGYTQLCIQALPADSPMVADLREINNSAERAAALTKQLLTFSRKETANPQAVLINTVLRGIEKMLHQLMDRDNVRLVCNYTDNVAPVKADPGQLEQVIVNMVVNARDAMPGGGTVTISTSAVDLDDGINGSPSSMAPGRYVVISVADTGEGMSEEVKEHLFEPFFTTKPKGRGTGLGLATCYGIIRQINGCIDVQSENGRGTRFIIYIPAITTA